MKNPDCYRNTVEMAQARGYIVENHTIITEDGYILTNFRIPGRKGEKVAKGSPILIGHGVLGSSDNTLDNGDAAITYQLADLGYDVWLLNNRGNRYSRKHLQLNPDKDSKFWQYSLHEMGIYDIKNSIEYIIKITGIQKVTYVGYSQSSGALLAGMSERPEFFKKHLKSVALWAPVSNMEHSNNIMKLVYSSYVFLAMDFLGLSELFPYDPALCSFTSVLCKLNPAICNLGLALITDVNPYYDNQERLEVLMAHYPVGTSILSIMHMTEMHVNKAFVKHRKTVLHEVDTYNLDNIDDSVPIALFIGKNDQLVVPKDAEWLAGVLTKNGALKWYKEYDYMGHITFVIPSKKVQQFLTDTVNFIKSH